MKDLIKIAAVVLAACIAWRYFFSGSSAGVSGSAASAGSLTGSSLSSSSMSVGQKLQALIDSGVPAVTVEMHPDKHMGSLTVPDYYGLGQKALQQELADLGKTYGDGVGYTLFQEIQTGDVNALYSTQSGTRSLMQYGNKSNSVWGNYGSSIMQGAGMALSFV